MSYLRTLRHEILYEQAPIFLCVLSLAFFASNWQHDISVLSANAFPLANVSASLWHLIAAGFVTGYATALVGQGAGILILPYQMSVLHFTAASVTPTTLLITLINPIGALLGFIRSRQINWLLAFYVCLGGVLGSVAGSAIRVTLLADPQVFKAAIGLMLTVTGIQLLGVSLKRYRQEGIGKAGQAAANGGERTLAVETLFHHWRTITVGAEGSRWSFAPWLLVAIGFAVAVFSSAVGIGGGVLLVPIFTLAYALPMSVIVAISIPYVIVMSLASILSYALVLPLLGQTWLTPELSWGLLVAAGGITGSWCASKSQRFLPETGLQLVLGVMTLCIGASYAIGLIGSFFRS